MGKWFTKSLLMAAVVLFAAASFGASWPFSGYGKTPHTLTICTNYKTPRLLADTIRVLSKQPFMLFPAHDSQVRKIYFMPARGTAVEITPDRVKKSVELLGPKRIIVIGDPSMVPASFVAGLETICPVIRIECNDWFKMSAQLEFMLNIPSLDRTFQRLYKELNDPANYRPTGLPAPKEPQVKAEEVKPAETAAAEEVSAVPESDELPEGEAVVSAQ